MPETAAPFYNIFIGSPSGDKFKPSEENDLIAAVSATFSSFSRVDVFGYYEGTPLPTIQIQTGPVAELCRSFNRILCLKEKRDGITTHSRI